MNAGRLDVDTTGLILFADDGNFIHHIASPKHHLEKVYVAELEYELTEEGAQNLLKGVRLENDHRLATALEITGIASKTAVLTIDEGRYHQVKRMFAAIGNKVVSLHRKSIAGVNLPDDLAEGEWRYLTPEELEIFR